MDGLSEYRTPLSDGPFELSHEDLEPFDWGVYYDDFDEDDYYDALAEADYYGNEYDQGVK